MLNRFFALSFSIMIHWLLVDRIHPSLAWIRESLNAVQGCGQTRRCCEMMNTGFPEHLIVSFHCRVVEDIIYYDCMVRAHKRELPIDDRPGFTPETEPRNMDVPQRISGTFEMICDLEQEVALCQDAPYLPPEIDWQRMRKEGYCIPRRVLYEMLDRAENKWQCLENFHKQYKNRELSYDYPGRGMYESRPRGRSSDRRTYDGRSSRNLYAVQGYTRYEDGRPYIAESLTLAIRNASEPTPRFERQPDTNQIYWDHADLKQTYQVCARAETDDLAPFVLGLAFILDVGQSLDSKPY